MNTTIIIDTKSLTPKTTIGGPLTKKHDAIVISTPRVSYIKRLGLLLLASPSFRETISVIAYLSIDKHMKRVTLLIPNPDKKEDVISAVNRYIPHTYEIKEYSNNVEMNNSIPVNSISPRPVTSIPSPLPQFDEVSMKFLRTVWMTGVTENKNGSFSQKEVFGHVGLGNDGKLSIDFNSIVFGNDNGIVTTSDSLISFHSHPESMYYQKKCKYAWPSGRDYNTICKKGIQTIHFIATREGIYRVTTTDVKPPMRIKILEVEYPYEHVNIMNLKYSEYLTVDFIEN